MSVSLTQIRHFITAAGSDQNSQAAVGISVCQSAATSAIQPLRRVPRRSSLPPEFERRRANGGSQAPTD